MQILIEQQDTGFKFWFQELFGVAGPIASIVLVASRKVPLCLPPFKRLFFGGNLSGSEPVNVFKQSVKDVTGKELYRPFEAWREGIE
jgi:hypothetical protein